MREGEREREKEREREREKERERERERDTQREEKAFICWKKGEIFERKRSMSEEEGKTLSLVRAQCEGVRG